MIGQKKQKANEIRLAEVDLSQSVRAYNKLEELLVSLELEPGSIFTEAQASELVGLGRTPVREALLRLAREKLVAAIPRKGFQVTPTDVREQLLVLEVRRPLDRFMAIRAARRAKPDERGEFEQIGEAMRRAEDKSDDTAFLRLDKAFNELLARAARNEFARDASAPLNALSRRFWMVHRKAGFGDLVKTIEMHIAIIRAISAGDEDAAAAASDSLSDHNEAFTRESIALDV